MLWCRQEKAREHQRCIPVGEGGRDCREKSNKLVQAGREKQRSISTSRVASQWEWEVWRKIQVASWEGGFFMQTIPIYCTDLTEVRGCFSKGVIWPLWIKEVKRHPSGRGREKQWRQIQVAFICKLFQYCIH